jgi:hypothetical protein
LARFGAEQGNLAEKSGGFMRLGRILVETILLGGLMLNGQRPANRVSPVFWQGDDLFVLGFKRAIQERRNGQPGEILNFPQFGPGFDVFEGTAWVTSWERRTTPSLQDGRVTKIHKRIGAEWGKEGEFEYRSGLIYHIHPLGNGRFWAFSPRSGNFVDSDGYSHPLAILSKHPETGKLSVYSVMDFELKLPFFRKARKASRNDGSDITYAGLVFDASNPIVMRAGSFLVLCFPDSGYFWVFDGQTGALKHRKVLYDDVGEELLSSRYRDLAPAILAAQPRIDGKILISARSRDAVEQAAKSYREMIPPISTDEDFIKHSSKIQEAWDLNIHLFPRVDWWVFDPDNGTIHEEVPPHSFPTHIRSLTDLNTYRWRFKPDGNLHYLGNQGEETVPPPPATKKIIEPRRGLQMNGKSSVPAKSK